VHVRKCSSATELCLSTEGTLLKKLAHSSLTVVVLGASGDLAKKKTFPALYGLFCTELLPPTTHIVGYARSSSTTEDFVSKLRPFCANIDDDADKLDRFLALCSYVSGPYDKAEGFEGLRSHLEKLEECESSNRLFYLALPPSVFVTAVSSLWPVCQSPSGWNRVVVEKPFGHDLDSSRELVEGLGEYLPEKAQYRIDHYLGKEMVQNLLVLRFSNLAFQPLWSRQAINTVTITFKEDFGTEGRGGYFDDVGIIRDVMQNHLLQVLSLVAMERPTSLKAEDVRDEKVKVLRCIKAIDLENVVLGQYVADKEGEHPSYTDDDGVPDDSRCPTFATAVLFVENERWAGVPFILKCGKALNERKAEVRLQFNDVPGQLFEESARNELVIRIQPNESTYMKIQVKPPGMALGTQQTELDLHYPSRFQNGRLPEAYERLLFDVIKGDQSQFVRADELEEAWKIFTPVLHQIDRQRIVPLPYEYGSRGPQAADALTHRFGFRHFKGYTWVDPRSRV